MVIAKWGERSFQVQTQSILSFSELMYDFEVETEEVDNGTQRYVKVKAQKPRSATLHVLLDARLGIAVRAHIDWFFERVYNGSSAYLYVKGEKLLPCELMIAKASVSGTTLAPDGTMLSAEVELTFMQSTRKDGTEFIAPDPHANDYGGGGGGGGGKGGGSGGGGSSNKSSVRKSSSSTGFWSGLGVVAGAVSAARAVIARATSASQTIRRITAKAKR